MHDPGGEVSKEAPKKKEISFHFEKSNHFRVIHVDGVFGGISPRGQFVEMGVFSERNTIPSTMVHPIDDDGLTGDEDRSKRTAREGVSREMEAYLVMDPEIAESVANWLMDKVKNYKQRQTGRKEGSTGASD